jgi:hypothetical protein
MPVAQQGDAGVVVKLECPGYAAVILVVAQAATTGALRRRKAPPRFVGGGLYVPVDDVAADEDEVGVSAFTRSTQRLNSSTWLE